MHSLCKYTFGSSFLLLALTFSSRLEAKVPLFLGFGFGAWQESLSIDAPSSTQNLLSNALVATASLSARIRLSPSFDAVLSGGPMFGIADVGAPVGDTPSISYRLTNTRVFGGIASASILWKLAGPKVAVGIGVPLIFKMVDLSPVDTDHTLNPDPMFALGVTLEAQYVRKTFIFWPQFGFLRSLSQSFWRLNFGWAY